MNKLNIIKTEVFKYRPILKEIYKVFGNWKLNDYVKKGWEVSKIFPEKNFINSIYKIAKKIYGQKTAHQIKSQLMVKPLISTIDHLGIWGHPFFVNSALIYSLHFKPPELAICLATESVSLNNTSSWSGSMLMHSQEGNLERNSFFPDRLKTLPVFSAPGVTMESLERFKKGCGKSADTIADTLKINVSDKSFSRQACVASFRLWKKVFPSAPHLVYLPLESIVIEYLENVASSNNDTIKTIIFTPAGRKLWKKYFESEHTFMFWGIDSKGRRVSIKDLPAKTDKLFDLINKRKIYPSSPLCFAVLLLSGFACVGGFTQTTWLTEVKEKFICLLKDLKISQDVILKIANIPTKNFAESSLASLKIGQIKVEPTALDLFFKNRDYYSEYLKLSEKLTLSQSLNRAMPEIYKVVKKAKLPL